MLPEGNKNRYKNKSKFCKINSPATNDKNKIYCYWVKGKYKETNNYMKNSQKPKGLFSNSNYKTNLPESTNYKKK